MISRSNDGGIAGVKLPHVYQHVISFSRFSEVEHLAATASGLNRQRLSFSTYSDAGGADKHKHKAEKKKKICIKIGPHEAEICGRIIILILVKFYQAVKNVSLQKPGHNKTLHTSWSLVSPWWHYRSQGDILEAFLLREVFMNRGSDVKQTTYDDLVQEKAPESYLAGVTALIFNYTLSLSLSPCSSVREGLQPYVLCERRFYL